MSAPPKVKPNKTGSIGRSGKLLRFAGPKRFNPASITKRPGRKSITNPTIFLPQQNKSLPANSLSATANKTLPPARMRITSLKLCI